MRTSKGLTIAVGAWIGLGVLGLGLGLELPAGSRGVALGQVSPRKSRGSKASARPVLRMSDAVVCRSIDGYEDYEPLPGASLTADEKLLIYYRPLNFRSALVEDMYQAHLTQDGQLRKKGVKKPLRQKLKILDFTTPKMEDPPELIYLRNTISLKGLEPGEYVFTIILHDQVAKGPPATQTVKFRIVSAQGLPKTGTGKKEGPRETEGQPAEDAENPDQPKKTEPGQPQNRPSPPE